MPCRNVCLIFWTFTTTIIALSLALLFGFEKYEFENELFFQIENIINYKLIYSFKKSSLCNIVEVELDLGIWDGTKYGCYCEGMIYDYKCSKDLISQGCKSIPSHNPTNYKMINSNYICIKKSSLSSKDLLIGTEQIKENNNNCSQKFNKSCGIIGTI